jgi:PAS domain S-box-containing protein
VALFVVITLVILILGYAYYAHETERIQRQKYEEIAAIANLKTQSIERWRKGLLTDVKSLSAPPFWKRTVKQLLGEPKNNSIITDLRGRLVAEQEQGGYADTLLLDLNGNILISASGQPESVNAIEKKAIEEAVTSGSPVLTDIYRTPDGTTLMAAVAPDPDPEGQSIAAAIYRVDPESFLFPLIQTWPTPSQTAETLLVRKDGDDVLFLNDLRRRANAALSLREPLSRHDLPASQVVSGKKGLFRGNDYRGVDVLADLRPIPDSPWFMVAKVDTSEILAEARYRGAVVVIFSGLFILLAGGLTAYAYRDRQAKLYNDLYQSELRRRQAEVQIRESSERYRSLVEHLPQRIFIKDRNSVYMSCNSNYASDLGITPKEIVGKDDFAFHIPKLAEMFRADDQSCMNDGMVKDIEEPYQLHGQERWAHTIKVPYRDSQGQIIGVLGIFEDITERKQIEERLKESEERFSKAFLLSPDPMTINAHADGSIVSASKGFCQTFGYTEEEVIGKSPLEIKIWDDPEDRNRFVEKVKTEGKADNIECRLRNKKGDLIYGLVSGSIIYLNGSPHIFIVAKDITERKRGEDALRESELRFRTLFETANDAILLMDTETFVECNTKTLQMYGCEDKKDIVGHTPFEFSPDKQPDGLDSKEKGLKYINAASDSGPQAFYWKHCRKDGSPFDAEVSLNALTLNGKVHFQVAARDISKRKRAEELLHTTIQRYHAILSSMYAGVLVTS